MARQLQRARSGILLVVAVLSLAATVTADPVLYVDADATGEIHDGSSWCNAFTDLQSALDLAGEGYTILVANGTYTPDPADLPRTAERATHRACQPPPAAPTAQTKLPPIHQPLHPPGHLPSQASLPMPPETPDATR